MPIDWQALLTTLSLSTIGVASIGFLAKSMMSHWFSSRLQAHQIELERDLEAHKSRLRLTTELELERFRADLQRAATEHQIRFTRLHEQQGEVIAGVFERLEKLDTAFARWAAIMKPGTVDMAKLAEEATATFNDFVDYYYPKTIFLDTDSCRSVESILQTLRSIFIDMSFDVDEKGFPRDRLAWGEAYKKLRDEIPSARKLLEERFRTTLGMPSSGGSSDSIEENQLTCRTTTHPEA